MPLYSTPSAKTSTAAPYWRIKNLISAGGSDAQWIAYELRFYDISYNDITTGGTPIASLNSSSAAQAFDKITSSFWSGAGKNTIGGWIGYHFSQAVDVYFVSLSNLNNGSNTPPLFYSLENSLDGSTWQRIINFQTGQSDGTVYYAVR